MLVALSLLAMAATLPVTCLADEPPPGAVGSAELAKRMAARAEIKLRTALAEATSLEFIETPLKDVVDFLKDLHTIEIQIDTKALDGVGVSADTPVTRNLQGVSLRSALSLMLKEFGLTFMIKDEVLQITTPEFVERHVTIKTYAVADIATDAPSGAALTTAVELALSPAAEPLETPESPKPRSEASRVVMLRGVLIVRGNPHEHERIDDLLAQLRRQLKLDDKQAASPLEGWKPGAQVVLQELRLRNEDLVHLKDQQQIRQLYLDSNEIGDQGLAHLRDLATLKLLSLDRNRVTDAGCAHLAGLASLTTLDLSGNEITDGGLSYLKELRELRELYLARTKIGDTGLAQLANVTLLNSLDLAKTAVTAKGLAQLKKCEKLRSLSLADTRVDSLKELPPLPSLIHLDLSRTRIREGELEHLTKFKKLAQLSLIGVVVSDMGLEYLARQQNLRLLALGESMHKTMSPEALEKLRAALPNCKVEATLFSKAAAPEDPFAPDPFPRAPAAFDPFGAPDPFR